MGAASQDVDALGCMQLFQSTCAVLSACFHSDLCQLGRLVTTRALLIPPSAGSPKAPGAAHSMWTCLQEDFLWTSDHRPSHVLLLLIHHKLNHFSITQFMCRKRNSSQNFKFSLYYFITCWLHTGALQKTRRKLPYWTPCPRGQVLSNFTSAFPDTLLV